MRERPILFSAPMVRAILEGRKTQTRRVVRGPVDCGKDGHPYWRGTHNGGAFLGEMNCPYGAPGDRLWVKETFAANIEADGRVTVAYRASCEDDEYDWFGPDHGLGGVIVERRKVVRWKPSIFMPRAFSRTSLELTGVRVERLQDISEEDAKAEGVEPIPPADGVDCWSADGKRRTAFEFLWNEINGWQPNAWEQNPWVWVVEFKRVEARSEAA